MQKVIQVFEFDTLYLGHYYKTLRSEDIKFEKRYFDALLKYNELHQGKYFAPVYEGIRFKSYVGVIQVDDLVIEILPKIQRMPITVDWRGVLVEMLQETDQLTINQVGNAYVEKQNIHLLDIYFDWFLTEVEQLMRQGLVKQYYTVIKNTVALKGKLDFAGHIQRNLIHQERFYNKHQVYGTDHLIHQVIQCALDVIENTSRGTYRYGRCKSLQLHFPEVQAVQVDPHIFSKISYSRKTAPYRIAIEIARLIILNYAPNVKSGAEHMLALLFNMNDLWECYVLRQLEKAAKNVRVYGQQSKTFWKNKSMLPDIVLEYEQNDKTAYFIIDTKWKNYSYENISSNDLRQLYVYCDYWQAKGGMLLYPSSKNENKVIEVAKYNDREYTGIIGQVSVLDEKGKLNDKMGLELLGLIEKELSKHQNVQLLR